MKSKMKKYVNLLGLKQLTNREALMFCIYQAALVFIVVYGVVLLQVGLYALILIFGNILPAHIIITMNMTFNILIMFRFIDHMNDLIQAVLCKCEDYYDDIPSCNEEEADDEADEADEDEVNKKNK
jgi:hypothetical protein